VFFLVFKEYGPSQAGERIATSLVLEFHRHEWNPDSPNQRCARRGMASRLVFACLHHLPQSETNRKFNIALAGALQIRRRSGTLEKS
jgi:hypothetical protein